jgi:hypothetical protein
MNKTQREQIFGPKFDVVDQLGDTCLTDEQYAHAVFDAFDECQEDTPAADLFRRERWHDLLALLTPGLNKRPPTTFVGTCMRRALLNEGDARKVVARINALLDNDYAGDVVTRVVALSNNDGWEELVKELAPHMASKEAANIVWDLKRIAADPDGLVEAIDNDAKLGRIAPLDAVERLRDVFYGSRFVRQAIMDLVDKLLPSPDAQFRTGCTTHLTNQFDAERRVIVNVSEVVVTAASVAAPEPAVDVEQESWVMAQAYIERLAKIVQPLTAAGLSSSDALDAANTAIGVARQQIERRVEQTSAPSSFQHAVHRSSGFARHYGATILDSND